MPTRPEDDVIALALRDQNGQVIAKIDTWESYSYNSHFLIPTDAWTFTMGDDTTISSIVNKMQVGQRASLIINNHIQGDGLIDKISVITDKSGGQKVQISGRDRMAPVVDSHIDPQFVRFTQGQTLQDVIYSVLYNTFPGGQGAAPPTLITDNNTNRNIITGQNRGIPTSKKGKPLKQYTLHQCKPYPNEGAFAFMARLAQRMGLWIWLSGDGSSVVVGQPDYDQDYSYRILHKVGGNSYANNVKTGMIERHAADQPSVIVATGWGGGGEYWRSGLKVAIVNELTGYTASGAIRPEVQAILTLHKDAVIVPPRSSLTNMSNQVLANRMTNAPHKPLFLHDDESKTIDELTAFAKREMSLKQRDAIKATYTVEGHTYSDESKNQIPWCIDTIVDVDDDVGGFNGKMWVMSRTFEKSRTAGTTTKLELILPYALVF